MAGRVETSGDGIIVSLSVCIDWMESDFLISCNIDSHWANDPVFPLSQSINGGAGAVF